VRTAEVLPPKSLSPLYTTVIECVPADKFGTENVALPPLIGKFVIKALPPSKNVTVPVAVDGVTAAVKVTDCPMTDGLGLEVIVVAVLGLTTCVRIVEVLPLSLLSPP